MEANIKAMNSSSSTSGEIYNISGGEKISVNDVLSTIENKLDKKSNVKYCEKRKGDVLNSYADISKAKKDLRYEPVVNFKSGIEKTIKWYQDKEK